MVKKCCVYTCPSESYSGCNISFQSFPKNEEMRQKWLSNIHVKQKITKNSVVCSYHFEPSCFYTANSCQLLKANAIPTIPPVVKNKKIVVLSDILIQKPHSGSSSSNIEEPPREKLCPNVKEVSVVIKVN